MKRLPKLSIVLFLASLPAALVFGVGGCINPPAHTLYVDSQGNHVDAWLSGLKADALAWDRNADGIPDQDANGKVAIVAGSEGYKTAETVDEIVPSALTGVGGLLGATGVGAVLVGLGAAWKLARFGRIFMNTVMCVQQARIGLQASGNADALAIVDDALSKQLPATVAAVTAIKEKCFAPSITVADSATPAKTPTAGG
jgi:hypothetical protein